MINARSSSAMLRILLLPLAACFLINTHAQTSRKNPRPDSTANTSSKTASTDELFDTKETNLPESEMRSVIERYTVDRASLSRAYPVSISSARQARFRQVYSDWLAQLQKLDFDLISQEGK